MAFEKHRWADFLQDVPADPAMGLGDGEFPLPLELRQSIAVHLERLGFQLVGEPRLKRVLPSADPMLAGAIGGRWEVIDGD